MPNSPVSEQGMRTEPPPSVPSANGVTPAATLLTAPQLEPPGVFFRFHGLGVTPVSGLSPTALQPNSLVVDLPMMQAPCALTLSTDGASAAATLSAIAFEPNVHLTPPTVIRSFTETGNPWRSPSRSPDVTACSALFAASRAMSGVAWTKQFSLGSSSSIRRKASSTTSTGEISLFAILSLSSIAVMYANSPTTAFLPDLVPYQMAPCLRLKPGPFESARHFPIPLTISFLFSPLPIMTRRVRLCPPGHSSANVGGLNTCCTP